MAVQLVAHWAVLMAVLMAVVMAVLMAVLVAALGLRGPAATAGG